MTTPLTFHPQCLIVQVIDPHQHIEHALAQMQEIEQLVDTLGGHVVQKVIQHRVSPHPATYIGEGKLNQLQQLVIAHSIDLIVVNDIVKSGQLFRLEKSFWDTPRYPQVWDRVDLILSIFAQHATTTASKLQIELARIQHQGPRVFGLGKDRLSRQGGGIGTRGLGETNIEREKRLIKNRVSQLKHQLERINRQKHQIIRRRSHLGLGPVALVGYTSAGKTTLFNRLTGKKKLAQRDLFTTLDTSVGKMKISFHQSIANPLAEPVHVRPTPPVVISDTIGFIQNLPPNLIDAFKSTLLESLEANLILHVIDAADQLVDYKIDVVQSILSELEVHQPIWLIFNQIDRLNNMQRQVISQSFPAQTRPEFQIHHISAKTGEGIAQLKSAIVHQLAPQLTKASANN